MPLKQRCVSCAASQRACDKTRPKCGRCEARSIDCIYPTKPDFAFVDQNAFSAESSRRAALRRSRGHKTVELGVLQPYETFNQNGFQNDFLHKTFEAPVLKHPPLWLLDDRVLARFFSRWAAGYTCLGSFDFYRQIYANTDDGSATHSAILATAYADLVVIEKHGDCVSKSYAAYQSTLRRIRSHLGEAKPTSVATDSTLTSIMVIDSFEARLSYRWQPQHSFANNSQLLYMRRPAPVGSHTTAIVQFLQLRQIEGKTDPRSVEMWRAAYPRLQARQLLCGLPSFDSSIGYLNMLGDNALDLYIAQFVAAACDAMFDLNQDLDAVEGEPVSQHKFVHRCNGLFKLLQETERRLEQCIDLPRMRQVDTQQPCHAEWPVGFNRERILVSNRFWIARDWILFHMCRVKISDLLLDIFSRQMPCRDLACLPESAALPRDLQILHTALSESCQFLLGTMPFLIGFVGQDGKANSTQFRETGLLIAHYPLWTIKQARNVPFDAKSDVAVLLQFLDARRNISDRAGAMP